MTFPATPKIAIIGRGYVGLPLAAHFANGFGKKCPVTGFDIKQGRIDELKAGRDSTREVEPAELAGFHAKVDIYNPWIDIAEAEHEYQVTPLKDKPQADTYDAIILAVVPAPTL